jgi:serine/threonine protein kinase/formylglycine-generating enzyme required for sulfatase activity
MAGLEPGGQLQQPSAEQATRSAIRTYSEPGPRAPRIDVEVVLGQTIGRYHVRRLIGEGGMGQVYLTRDVVLGRSVALKFVGGNVCTERVLDEAVAIARLNHPNIVQLYDFGEYERAVYLALEYVEGDTLRERIARGRIELDLALRYTAAIADALAHAHGAGVFHCDLKPSNVMIGRDGRIRVVDFGIARTAADAIDGSGGTPDWMAPEQWAGGPITDRVDIWALAIIAAQLATALHPLGADPETRQAAARDPDRTTTPGLDARGLPAPVIDLITRSLAHDPAQRPSAADWLRIVADVISGRGDAFGEDAPYPGLSAFGESQTRFYFGREHEIDEFLERLRATPILPIVGPSGSGKSSFLHAGIIPRLRAGERWTVISFRSGVTPLDALARHVVAAMTGNALESDVGLRQQFRADVKELRDELLDRPAVLAVRLATLAATHGSRVLVAVDQLEEVFTQCTSDVERSRFLATLLAAADDVLDPVRVVFTVRDDFFSKIAGLRSLFMLHTLHDDDLRRTITGPLARHRYEFDDPAIVDDLIAEVGSAKVANLPLLQFACRTLWDGRNVATRQLRRRTYQDMGGLAGALAQHAERALAELTPDNRRTARQLLLHLVSGTTRRSVGRDQLVIAVGREADAVIDHLLRDRLLVQHSRDGGDGSVVEIAHESLLQTWSQLARWVDESRDERRLLAELEEATSWWERRGKRSEETWSHNDIATARHRASQLAVTLPDHVQAFFAAGDQRHRTASRKRRIRAGIGLASLCGVAVLGSILIARYLAREQLIRVNAGTVELSFRAYDWIAGSVQPVPLDQLPGLSWKLYATKPGDPHQPGEQLPDDVVGVLGESSTTGRRSWKVRAPGGMAFLRIDGRGRAGERCAPSWIRLQALPGYASAGDSPRLDLAIPTCQVTRADMIAIEAGDFLYGGPGEPPSSLYGQHDYDEPEQRIHLDRFAIDRTEVSNAAYAPFAHMEAITSYPAPIYPDNQGDMVHAHDSEGTYPVTEIDWFQADAYCRYLGKSLPSDYQWVKAARGGLTINGNTNPFPRRLYPWGAAPAPRCTNMEGLQDSYRWIAPVDALPCGASPYGVLNLAGNVQEWISRIGQTDIKNPLYAIRGGGADSPPELDHTTTIFRNHKDPRAFNYSVGLRCASADKENLP